MSFESDSSADRNLNREQSPSEMNDEDLKLVVAQWFERQQDIENQVAEKNTERSDFLRPVYQQIDTFLENNSILDEETKDQVQHISTRGFGKALSRLNDEKTVAEFGKGISLLREKGILTDEIIGEASALEDSLDSHEMDLKGLSSSEDPDYGYLEEYYARRLDN